MDNITSRTIERLRFPMTVLVLFIHVLPFAASQGGIEYTFPFNTDSWSHRFIYFFNWIFPRVAVPMFCIISGYLFFQGNPEFYLRKTEFSRELNRILIYSNAKKLDVVEYAAVFNDGYLLDYVDVQSVGGNKVQREVYKAYEAAKQEETGYIW